MAGDCRQCARGRQFGPPRTNVVIWAPYDGTSQRLHPGNHRSPNGTRCGRSAACSGPSPDPAKRPFTIVIPPPNVTGSLHMGHALEQHPSGRAGPPGAHERIPSPLDPRHGPRRHRHPKRRRKNPQKRGQNPARPWAATAFLERMWAWRKESGDAILHQLRKLGSSLDWTRTRFTMDEKSSRAVRRAFVDFHKRGKVYLGKRLVNWCARCGTALSDIEVEYVEQSGHLWHIRYPLADGGDVVVATTRPETMLGDTAVAVHPEDPRYADKRGRPCACLCGGRAIPISEIPLVFDAAVDKSFGSGAVKVTPAHDATDADIGARHKLAVPHGHRFRREDDPGRRPRLRGPVRERRPRQGPGRPGGPGLFGQDRAPQKQRVHLLPVRDGH
jgi:hypothetical protein